MDESENHKAEPQAEQTKAMIDVVKLEAECAKLKAECAKLNAERENLIIKQRYFPVLAVSLVTISMAVIVMLLNR